MSSAGATPKEITSTSESSSAPNRLLVLDSRATRPSSMSRIAAKTMNHPAQRKLPLKAETIDQKPKNRLPRVNALGITTTTCRMIGPAQMGTAGISSIEPPGLGPRGSCRPRAPGLGCRRAGRDPPASRTGSCPGGRPGARSRRRVVGDDAARDQTGDLADQHLAVRRRQPDRRLLVVQAGLLIGRMEKPAGIVMPVRDRAVRGYRLT